MHRFNSAKIKSFLIKKSHKKNLSKFSLFFRKDVIKYKIVFNNFINDFFYLFLAAKEKNIMRNTQI